ncbi:DoxX family membrane protein [Patulibacter sp.]|uniref:DoxX family membrane protein n=1 Tax=Patulibacter sp. TaxID=1912859 RepID=UPI002725FC2E|nr:DoxX family membrane protein [Patulibacter sp.]MDO9409917.1 DoxX family membrane protein [Patulibacter sp.]
MHAVSAFASERFLLVEDRLHDFAVRHGFTLLRTAFGFVFFLFGFLKFFPGLSPAQDIAEQTTGILFLHLVPPQTGLLVVAVMECTVGLCLLTGRYLRQAVWLLAGTMIGILSPLVLLTGQLFTGPHGLPNLLGQYILKDVILAAGVLVMAAHTRGGKIAVPEAPDPAERLHRTAVAARHRTVVPTRAPDGLRRPGSFGEVVRASTRTQPQRVGSTVRP